MIKVPKNEEHVGDALNGLQAVRDSLNKAHMLTWKRDDLNDACDTLENLVRQISTSGFVEFLMEIGSAAPLSASEDTDPIIHPDDTDPPTPWHTIA